MLNNFECKAGNIHQSKTDMILCDQNRRKTDNHSCSGLVKELYSSASCEAKPNIPLVQQNDSEMLNQQEKTEIKKVQLPIKTSQINKSYICKQGGIHQSSKKASDCDRTFRMTKSCKATKNINKVEEQAQMTLKKMISPFKQDMKLEIVDQQSKQPLNQVNQQKLQNSQTKKTSLETSSNMSPTKIEIQKTLQLDIDSVRFWMKKININKISKYWRLNRAQKYIRDSQSTSMDLIALTDAPLMILAQLNKVEFVRKLKQRDIHFASTHNPRVISSKQSWICASDLQLILSQLNITFVRVLGADLKQKEFDYLEEIIETNKNSSFDMATTIRSHPNTIQLINHSFLKRSSGGTVYNLCGRSGFGTIQNKNIKIYNTLVHQLKKKTKMNWYFENQCSKSIIQSKLSAIQRLMEQFNDISTAIRIQVTIENYSAPFSQLVRMGTNTLAFTASCLINNRHKHLHIGLQEYKRNIFKKIAFIRENHNSWKKPKKQQQIYQLFNLCGWATSWTNSLYNKTDFLMNTQYNNVFQQDQSSQYIINVVSRQSRDNLQLNQISLDFQRAYFPNCKIYQEIQQQISEIESQQNIIESQQNIIQFQKPNALKNYRKPVLHVQSYQYFLQNENIQEIKGPIVDVVNQNQSSLQNMILPQMPEGLIVDVVNQNQSSLQNMILPQIPEKMNQQQELKPIMNLQQSNFLNQNENDQSFQAINQEKQNMQIQTQDKFHQKVCQAIQTNSLPFIYEIKQQTDQLFSPFNNSWQKLFTAQQYFQLNVRLNQLSYHPFREIILKDRLVKISRLNTLARQSISQQDQIDEYSYDQTANWLQLSQIFDSSDCIDLQIKRILEKTWIIKESSQIMKNAAVLRYTIYDSSGLRNFKKVRFLCKQQRTSLDHLLTGKSKKIWLIFVNIANESFYQGSLRQLTNRLKSKSKKKSISRFFFDSKYIGILQWHQLLMTQYFINKQLKKNENKCIIDEVFSKLKENSTKDTNYRQLRLKAIQFSKNICFSQKSSNDTLSSSLRRSLARTLNVVKDPIKFNEFSQLFDAKQSIQHQHPDEHIPFAKIISRYQGLSNRKFQCYSNAVLQVIFNFTAIFKFIIKKQNQIGSLLMMLNLARINGQKNRSCAIKDLINAKIALSNQHISYQQQQDAQFYLVRLLQAVLKDKSERKLQNIFSLHYIQSVVCNLCQHSSDTSHQQLNISLRCQKKSMNVQEACVQFFQNTEISGYKCSNCQQESVRKQSQIIKLPQILILNISVFEYNRNKAKKKNVDIDFYEQEYINLFDSNYQLKGIILHLGDKIQRGHYISYVKVQGQKSLWIRYDDEKLTEISHTDLLDQKDETPYILFYQKIPPIIK